MIDKVLTSCATITRIGTHEVEIRFAPGMRIDRAAIAEVISERKRMVGKTPIGVLMIVPGDAELDMAVVDTDHLKANQATDTVLAFAMVASNAVSETLLRLYKAYYPTVFQMEVFTDEAEARTWLRARIAATGAR